LLAVLGTSLALSLALSGNVLHALEAFLAVLVYLFTP